MGTSETLLTERLLLEQYTHDDLENFVGLVTNPDTTRHVGNGALVRDAAVTMFRKTDDIYERGAFDIWAVRTRADRAYVGHAEIKPRKGMEGWEIVYILEPAQWGRGYATEIARALVDYGFERLGLRRVLATVDLENTASLRVLEKVGLRFVGEERDDDGAYGVYAIERYA